MSYMKSEVRKDQILEAAMIVASETNYLTMKRSDIAQRAGCAESLVSKYFNTMGQLRRAVMRHAAKGGHSRVLAQGLANKDPNAMKSNKEVKRLAGQSLME